MSILQTPLHNDNHNNGNSSCISQNDQDATVCIPVRFDGHQLFYGDEQYVAGAEYILDRVIAGSQIHLNDSAQGFVPLKVDYLRKVISRHHEYEIRRTLIEHHVLECDQHYLKGRKAMGYRLTESYQGPFEQRDVKHGPTAERIRKIRSIQEEWMLPVHHYLTRQFERLSVDFRYAVQNPGFWDYMSLFSQSQLGTGDWRPAVCNYGRFHSPLTRMNRVYRSGLRLNGEPVYEIDIVNSQPFLLAVLYRICHPENHRIESVESNAITAVSKYMGAGLREWIDKGVQPPITMDRKIVSYQQLTSRGKFYESLIDGNDFDRDEFKRVIFRDVLFGRNQIQNNLKREFERRFPEVAKFVRLAKREDYRKLAHMLQRLESFLIIDQVCGRLMTDFHEIPILTIHDSLLTTQKHVERIKSVIQEVFKKETGLQPSLKITAA